MRLYTNSNHHELIKEKYIALDELDKAGYWQVGIKYNEDGTPVDDEFYRRLTMLDRMHSDRLTQLEMTAPQVWDKYLSSTVTQRRLMRSTDQPTNYAVYSIIKTMELVRKAHRYTVLMSDNGRLDQHVIKWWGNLPTQPMNSAYFEGLYGEPPSQIRQMPHR